MKIKGSLKMISLKHQHDKDCLGIRLEVFVVSQKSRCSFFLSFRTDFFVENKGLRIEKDDAILESNSSDTNGCFLKWWYPQIINFYRNFHYFHHPFWVTPYFWIHPNGLQSHAFLGCGNSKIF